jgi:hypothetical protein
MSKFDKQLTKLLFGNSDNNFRFNDLVGLLLSLGFEMRINGGSHHIFTRQDVAEIINIQPINNKAKPYQIKQVRALIIKYKLWQDGTESQ